MPLRRYLSRRIIHRSFTLSKSSEIESITGDGTIQPREENDCEDDVVSSAGSDSWAGMLPELLGEIIQRVEATEGNWPQRQNVVACGCVCKRWRDATAEAVEKASLRHPGKITFPSSLKKPGSRDSPIHCLMKRDKKNSTFYLYLALTPSFTEKGKFLLAARRYRNGGHTEYIITLDANDPSPGSKAYVGKLRSDFTGTSFKIFDSQPPHSKAKPSSCRSGRRVASKQISPQIPTNSNFEVGQVSYKFNLLKSRGPRRMVCSLSCPSSERVSVSDNNNNINNNNKKKKKKVVGSKIEEAEPCAPTCTILKNKTPRWHENLECWCLNFHGRVTFASVKNFQLIATVDQSQLSRMGDEETVLLQFGKVGDDTFTLDYRQPLSAFQAFAICLTSFGTKLACE